MSNPWLDLKLSLESNGYNADGLGEAEVSIGDDGKSIDAGISTNKDKVLQESVDLNKGYILDEDEKDILLQKDASDRTEQQKVDLAATLELQRAGANDIKDWIGTGSTVSKRRKNKTAFREWTNGVDRPHDPLYSVSIGLYQNIFRDHFCPGEDTEDSLHRLQIDRNGAQRIAESLWTARRELAAAGIDISSFQPHLENYDYMRLVSFVFRKMTGLKLKSTGANNARVYVVDKDHWEIMKKSLIQTDTGNLTGLKMEFYCPKDLSKRISTREEEETAALDRFFSEIGDYGGQCAQLL